MRRSISRSLAISLVNAGLLFWSGCGLNTEHACCEHGHDHAGKADQSADEPSDTESTGHSHVGPNGGRLIVLGDEDYHAELTIDHEKAEATVCLLDQTGRNPVCVEQKEITLNFRCQGQPHQIRLTPVHFTRDTAAGSSCFRGTSDALRGECQLAGRLNVVIKGKPYTGHVAHHEDDHKVIR